MLQHSSVEDIRHEYQGLLNRAPDKCKFDDNLHIIDIISQISKHNLSSEYVIESTNDSVNELFNGGLVSNKLNIFHSKDVYLSELVSSCFIANTLISNSIDVIYITIKSFHPKLIISQLNDDCDYKEVLSRLQIIQIYGIDDLISSINYIRSLDCKVSLVVINGLNSVFNKANIELIDIIIQSLKILQIQLACCILVINDAT